jgi:L-malate glycosyltransferase
VRIALVADPSSPHTGTWTKGLADRGHEVHLFSPHKATPPADPYARIHAPLASGDLANGIPAAIVRASEEVRPVSRRSRKRGWPSWLDRGEWDLGTTTRALRLVPAFRRWLRGVKPDRLVALRFQPEGYLASMGGFRPLILVSWGQDVLWFAAKHPGHRFFTRQAIRAAHRVIGETAAVVEGLRDLGATSEQCVQAYVGIDVEFWSRPAPSQVAEMKRTLGGSRPSWTRWLQQSEQGVPVLFSPRAIGLHGYQRELIRAWADLARFGNRPDGVSPLLQAGVGSPRERESCRRLAEELAAGARYHDLGHLLREDLRAVYWVSDVAVSLWMPDGLSQSLLEMMAAGSFPVAADLPGNREWIRHGENGLLVDPTDAAALCAALERALTDSRLRDSARALNLSLIHERADQRRNLDHLTALICAPQGGERRRD